MFVDVGCDDVRTYIQSGNVLFRMEPTLGEDIPSLISASILSRFGYRIPVVTRTAQELQEIVRSNPFVQAGAEADKLHVVFLAELPDNGHVETLDPNRSPADEFAVVGREVYLHCPNGPCAHQAHQQLLRLQAFDNQYDAKLEDGAETSRSGHRQRVRNHGPRRRRSPRRGRALRVVAGARWTTRPGGHSFSHLLDDG